jgi:hypothetical protein
MVDDDPGVSRYRPAGGTLDSLRREVRELTNEILEARKQLQREVPRRRRSDRAAAPPGDDRQE